MSWRLSLGGEGILDLYKLIDFDYFSCKDGEKS